MNEPLATDVIFKFENPWYPPSPEIFVTSLAWSLFSIEGSDPNRRMKFKRGQRQSLSITSTNRGAEYSAETLASGDAGFANQLATSGFATVRSASNSTTRVSRDFVLATLNAVSGTTANSSDGIAVSPLTPALAMAQTVKGMRGANANYALMAEQLWRVTGQKSSDLAESWLEANDRLLRKNVFLRQLDRALDSTQGFGPRVRKVAKEVAQPWRLGDIHPEYLAQTPFGWFERSWTNLTSDAWIDALPPRVWTDWATTLIRTAYGLGILWQSNWYHLVARSILDGESQLPLQRINSLELIPWQPRSMPITLRHVKSTLDARVTTSFGLKAALVSWIDEFYSGSDSKNWSDFAVWLRSENSRVDKLSELMSLRGKYKGAPDAVEAVNYSLNVRKDFGEGADNFGLLRKSSRNYRVPQPATEWYAAISSLISPRPKSTINLGQLQSELQSMGLRPPTADLIQDLESAGLAKGSADADLGLEIQTAY